MIRTLPLAGAVALALAACTPTTDADVSRADARPADAAPGACYARDLSPAVIETVTDQVLVTGAVRDAEGRVLSPAVYQTVTRQEIVQERQELWFETPCERDLTPDFVDSLQRALAARGLYTGPINGRMTQATRSAVRAYQAPRGLDSNIVSMETARALGLAAVERDAASG